MPLAVGLVFLLCDASVTRSADRPAQVPDVPLVGLALARFHTLTRAERALLEFADKSNIGRDEFAIAGTSAAPLDPSNDPKNAAVWPHDRDIRADLIRWLATDDAAGARVDPDRIHILGARIIGSLRLSRLRIPFGIKCVRCAIPDRIELASSEIPYLNLNGSYIGEVFAPDLSVHGELSFANDEAFSDLTDGTFDASGLVDLYGAKIDGALDFDGGHFHYSDKAPQIFRKLRMAVFAAAAQVRLDVNACCGFESDGDFEMPEASIGADFNCMDARFINPNNSALTLVETNVGGAIVMTPHPYGPSGRFESDGMVNLWGAKAEYLAVAQATFGGKADEAHGLNANGISVHKAFLWQDVILANGAMLDLSGANLGAIVDDERSWPQPGKLAIDNLTYDSFGFAPFGTSSPRDARSRLRWLGLQDGYHPQPYRQLAKVLRENGDDAGAIEVLVAQQDARFRNASWLGRAWARFLRITVGYGHKPMRTVLWSLAVILTGWLMVTLGARAGVMRATWPDAPPASEPVAYEKLHLLLYSLDVFLPFVNLHQEHYWWPDANAHGEAVVMNRRLKLSGAVLRYYLWMQVIAGWLLSAIFVAGVTGLMRND